MGVPLSGFDASETSFIPSKLFGHWAIIETDFWSSGLSVKHFDLNMKQSFFQASIKAFLFIWNVSDALTSSEINKQWGLLI